MIQDFTDLEQGSIIELFILDLTAVTKNHEETKLYLTNSLDNDRSPLQYDGNIYTALPLLATGFEISAGGVMPRPSLEVGNVGGTYNTLLGAFNNFVGGKVERIKVFYDYLDGKPKGGLQAYINKDKWFINKKTKHDNVSINFSLKNPLDLEKVLVPKRQFLRKCQHTYRYYRTDTMSFVQGSCPYTDSVYFDELGNATSKEKDLCGKRLGDCVMRFQNTDKNAIIPIWGFPLVPKY